MVTKSFYSNAYKIVLFAFNMKKKLVLAILVFLVLIAINIFAQEDLNLETSSTSSDINQVKSTIEIPYGENATATLPMYSKTYLRVYEGSKINFNIVDPDNGVILIKNNVIIKEIRPTSAVVLLSVDNSEYEETMFSTGYNYQINYTYTFMPYMGVEQIISHYEEDSNKRSIVLYLLVPFLKTSKSDFSQVIHGEIDPSFVNPTGSVVEEDIFSFSNPSFLVGILVIVLVAMGLLIYAFSKKPKRR